MNKTLIKNRFQEAQGSYLESATIQIQMAQTLTAQLKHHWQPQYKKMLEIGIGTGCFTNMLKSQFPLEKLVANDLMDQPPADLLPLMQSGWLSYIPGDAEQLAFDPDTFDGILSNATVQWFDTLFPTLQQWLTWIKPQGVLAFTTFGPNHFALLKKITGKGLTYHPYQSIIKALRSQTDCLWFHEEDQILSFPGFIELLKHIKATGTNALGTSFSTKSELYQMALAYQKQNSTNRPFPLHYHPYWFIFRKKG